jgi:hypothetical protein
LRQKIKNPPKCACPRYERVPGNIIYQDLTALENLQHIENTAPTKKAGRMSFHYIEEQNLYIEEQTT